LGTSLHFQVNNREENQPFLFVAFVMILIGLIHHTNRMLIHNSHQQVLCHFLFFSYFFSSLFFFYSDFKHIAFFEKYAKDNGFDPLNPDNWYSQTHRKIAARVLFSSFHNTSLIFLFLFFYFVSRREDQMYFHFTTINCQKHCLQISPTLVLMHRNFNTVNCYLLLSHRLYFNIFA
jgi:hypothetical protein